MRIRYVRLDIVIGEGRTSVTLPPEPATVRNIANLIDHLSSVLEGGDGTKDIVFELLVAVGD